MSTIGTPGTAPLQIAVALDGAGWHPAAWRLPQARPADLFGARYWTDLVTEAERGGVDLVTFEDALRLQSHDRFTPDRRTDEVRGRLDAVLVATRVAPVTDRIGLLPTVVTSLTEPFHAAKAIATLDHISHGRAGVRVQVGGRSDELGHLGRDRPTSIEELFAEAGDYVEVLRRLWDSWEDDAEIRDVATGRFIDRNKLHHIDFSGATFSVKGPSITPRPPQGQPLVGALGHVPVAYRLIAQAADLAFVTPRDAVAAAAIVDELEAEQPVRAPTVFADLLVLLEDTPQTARAALDELDSANGAPLTSDALIVTDTPAAVADLIEDWRDAGIDGVRLRPARLPRDLDRITSELLPLLRRRGLHRGVEEPVTLRERLGLIRPANRYALI